MTINITAHGADKTIHFAKEPPLSKDSEKILCGLNPFLSRNNLPVHPQDSFYRGQRSENSEVSLIKTKLQNAKDNRTKDTLIALAKTALLAALIAGGVLSCLFSGGGPMLLLAVLCFGLSGPLSVVFSFTSYDRMVYDTTLSPKCKDKHNIRMHGGHLGGVLLGFIGGGLVIPLFEVLTLQSRLGHYLKEHQEESELASKDFLPEQQRYYSDLHAYYTGTSAKLVLEVLEEKIQHRNDKELNQAKQELEATITFYKTLT